MAAPSVPYEDWLIAQLKNPAEAAAYLETVLDEGDQAAIMLALRQVAQAQGGVAEIARKAKLTREATYKMLSKSGNPELRSLTAVLEATGLRIAVKPIEKQAASSCWASMHFRPAKPWTPVRFRPPPPICPRLAVAPRRETLSRVDQVSESFRNQSAIFRGAKLIVQ